MRTSADLASRITTLLPALVLCLAGCLLPGCNRPSSPAPEGILLITVDTLRADHLGGYGARPGMTPRMDRLAGEGVLFEDASTPVPITLPAHASLFTGVSPPVHGVRDNADFRLGEDLPTMAELLGEGGWEGGAVVGAVVLNGIFGLDRGFSYYDDSIDIVDMGAHDSSYAERPGEQVVDAALAWLGERPEGAGFFLWVHLFDPHAPYDPPASQYDDTYEGEVAYTDDQVGRLLDGLDELGRADSTLVILTSDHGEGLGEHGEATHGFFVYQSTMHVPLLMRLPGRIPAGGRVSAPVSLVDVLPTVLESAGIPQPPDLEGHSLLPAATTGEEPETRDQYLETYLPYFQMRWSGSRGLRDGRWKLIDAPAPELYDLQDDPGEITNLVTERAELPSTLQSRLEARARWMAILSGAGTDAPTLDDDTRRQMRSLGYLSGGGEQSDELTVRSLQRPDTKEKVHLVDEIQQAVRAAMDGQDVQAFRRLADLAAQDADNPRLLTLLGMAQKRYGDLESALNSLVRAAELEPDDARAHGNVALVLRELGQAEGARAALDRAVAATGDSPRQRRFVASLLLDAGDAVRAESEFGAILRANPRDMVAREGLARALASQGRWAEALDALEQVITERPDVAELWTLAGEAALRGGDAELAKRHLSRALELDPARQDAQQMLNQLP